MDNDTLVTTIHSLLTQHGWTAASQGSVGELWAPNGNLEEPIRVGIPFQLSDDPVAYEGVVKRIASALNSDYRTIDAQIQHWNVDITRIRSQYIELDPEITFGAPLSVVSTLLSGTRKIFQSAAFTARKKRAHIGSNLDKESRRRFESIRAGYTERGSYILPVYVPVTEPMAPEEGIPVPSPERSLTRTVAQSIALVDKLIIQPEKVPTPSEVRELIKAGVSKELLSGIEELVHGTQSGDSETTFEWAPSHAEVEPVKGLPERIVVPREAHELLSKASECFVTECPSSEFIEGTIRALARDDDGRNTITLKTKRNGREAHVDVKIGTVSDAHLDDLLKWFRDGTTLSCEGVIQRISGTLTMEASTGVYAAPKIDYS